MGIPYKLEGAPEDAGAARAAQAGEVRVIKLYSQLPILLQHAACSVEGWRIQRRRYGSGYAELQLEVNERTFWPRERIAEFRDRRIAGFVKHAAQTCEWYRQQMRRLRISPEEIRGLSDLARLPIVTKSNIQAQMDGFVSKTQLDRHTVMAHTSGTTGGALRFPVTEGAAREQWAVWWRYRASHGITRETWCGYFGGRNIVPVWQESPPYWRYNWPARQIMFSAYHMRPENVVAYASKLRESRVPWLHGYPSVLALLASLLLDTGTDLGYSVRWVTTGAENLLPHQADVIERAFGVRPRQHYGMAEAVANFSECEFGRLHVDEDFAGVEFVPVGDGATYRVIGTNFSNPAMPLIRYDTEDLVQLAEGNCACGRPGRLVAQIDGRKEDYVVLRDGTRIGRMDHVFKDMVHIREAQIFQSEPGAVVVRVVRGRGYSEQDEQRLLKAFWLRLGHGASVTVEYHNKLARSGSGKLRFVVSTIESGKIEATQRR